MTLQRRLDLIVKIIALQQLRSDVYRHGQRCAGARLKLRTERQSVVQHMPSQGIEQTSTLNQRKKLRR
ncbi:hypothetical protein D3C81_2252690 [compost metagenome]